MLDRLGYGAECDCIQELYLAGEKAEAISVGPTKLVEEIALIGAPEKIRDELAAWEESVIITMLVQGPAFALRTIKDVMQGGSPTRARLRVGVRLCVGAAQEFNHQ